MEINDQIRAPVALRHGEEPRCPLGKGWVGRGLIITFTMKRIEPITVS